MLCRKCKRELSVDNFRKSKHYKSGYMTICKDCMKEKESTPEAKRKKKEQGLKWRQKNPDYYIKYSPTNERRKEYNKRYREKNIEKYKERDRIRSKNNALQIKNNKFKREYGITIDDYNLMLKNQHECCCICKQHYTLFKKALCVDHDHVTNKVRGLLCDRCNNLLSRATDSIDILKSAISYLEKQK